MLGYGGNGSVAAKYDTMLAGNCRVGVGGQPVSGQYPGESSSATVNSLFARQGGRQVKCWRTFALRFVVFCSSYGVVFGEDPASNEADHLSNRQEAIEDLTGWKGVALLSDRTGDRPATDQSPTGKLSTDNVCTFRYGTSADWRSWDGFAFDIFVPGADTCRIEVKVAFDWSAHLQLDRSEFILFPLNAKATVSVRGQGWHQVHIPFTQFDSVRDQPGMWQYVREIRVAGEAAGSSDEPVLMIRQPRLTHAQPIGLTCKRRGLAIDPGQTAEYQLSLVSHSDQAQWVRLAVDRVDGAPAKVKLSTEAVMLQPKATVEFSVQIQLDDDLAIGGEETIDMVAVADGQGDRAARLALTTVRRRAHPYILLTEDGWQRVRQKVERLPWAKQALQKTVEVADRWDVPPPGDGGRTVFSNWGSVMPLTQVSVAWKLTGDPAYRDKIIEMLRRLADPEKGYLATSKSVSSGGIGVHEGMAFSAFCIAYDAVYEEPEISAAEHEQLRAVLEHYLDQTEDFLLGKLVYNYSTCANAGGILAALVLQDMTRLDTQLYGPGGFAFQIAHGVMDDGWHMEGATNYHVLIMRYYALAVAACDNWGLDLYDARFAVPPNRLIEQGSAFQGYLGMSFEKWGPTGRNYRSFRDMLDGMIPLMDHQAVVIANNDSRRHLAGDVFEQAYARWRDPAHAWVIRKTGRGGYTSEDDGGRTEWRSLLYGLDDVPDVPDPRAKSTLAANLGVAVLRSQTPGREPGNQIMAALKWGTHGGWHGHFDRTGLLALQRYGKDFYMPIAGFDGYYRDQYKMWDQASASHNMVVVDEGLQEPVESQLLLFQGGKLAQAAAVQTEARWSPVPDWMKFFPPKFGDDLYETGIHFDPTFRPVLQRRVMVVTDDFIVLSDFLSSDRTHVYDWLLHPVGLRNLEAVSKTLLRHEDAASTEPVSSYKYMTDCDWYQIEGPMLARFEDEGIHLDVHTVWPPKADVMIGTVPQVRSKPKSKDEMRRTLLVRVEGKTAHFLTVLEPYKDRHMIRGAKAAGPDRVTVKLTDGRVQQIAIRGLEGNGSQLSVEVREVSADGTLREETLSGVVQ